MYSISKYTAVLAIIVTLLVSTQNDLVASQGLQTSFTTWSTTCRSNNTFLAYQVDLREALTRLTNAAAANATFSNTTVGPDGARVFAFYYCTGNVTKERCSTCLESAARDVAKNCNNYTEGTAWSYDCTLWYADWMIFGAEDGKFSSSEFYPNYYGSYDRKHTAVYGGREVVEETAEELIQAAANDTRGDPAGFAMKEVAVSWNETLAGLAQCAPWVTGDSCLRCLRNATRLWAEFGSKKARESPGFRSLIFQPSCRLHLSIQPAALNSTSPATPSNTTINKSGTMSRSAGEVVKYSYNNVIVGAIALTFFAVLIN